MKALNGLMNNTKWGEIRLAMLEYPLSTVWRTKNIENGYISYWDGDWYYHFRIGGYDTIEWLEIKTTNNEMKNDLTGILKKIHVPAEVLDSSIKIYGYKRDGAIDYL